MKLVSAEKPTQRRPQSIKPLAMLDDPEMALTLQQLGESATGSRLSQTLASPDLLAEYASAASMIMDKEEREAVITELLLALRNHPVAAKPPDPKLCFPCLCFSERRFPVKSHSANPFVFQVTKC